MGEGGITASRRFAPTRLPRWLVAVSVAALALVGLELARDRARGPAPVAVPAPAIGLPGSYQTALARIDGALAPARARASERRDEWLIHDVVARTLLARARLTGSYADYAEAQGTLTRAFGVAAPRTGPHQSAAVLAFTMHRLSEAERYLDEMAGYAVQPERGELAEQVAMRGDIALYRGRYAEALAAYNEADRLSAGAADFRRAVFHSKTGRPDLADAFYVRTARGLTNPSPQTLANLELQRGILDLERGRLDQALGHFRRADAIFPGHWLIEEHIAEVTTLHGDLDGAERMYRDIVRRTGHPEFMDALAGIAEQRGDQAARRAWTGRAARAWSERLRLFPEAAYGHAIDHCIDKGDWPCALRLASRNHAARPYGDAKVALARALLGSGRADEAQRVIEPVLASPWRTADLHRTAADIYQARGMPARAAEQDRRARAINPLA